MISETTLYRDWFCEPRSPLCSRSLSTFFTASLIAFISEISRRSEMFPWQAPASARPSSRCFLLFATLIGIGGSVLFSMRLGAKDQEKAKNLLGTSFSMLLVFFRCAYHFVSIAESSASSMVRRKPNNISLRQYLHDDLYTRHVLRPAVHGHELFHHRAGISGAWDGNNLDRCGCQHRTGSHIYLSAAYEYCRCCPRYRPRAVVFLCFCPADTEAEKNAHSPDTGTDPAFYRSTHPENGLFSLF